MSSRFERLHRAWFPTAGSPASGSPASGSPASGAAAFRSRRAGSVRATWIAALAVFAAAALAASAFQVRTGENVIVLRFGDPSRVVTEPGLHFKLPAPVDTLQRIDMRTHVLDPAPAEFLTLEQRNLEIDSFVAWRVADPRVFLTSLRDRAGADARIEQVLQSAVNDVMTDSPLADIVSVEPRERDLKRIADEVRELVARGCRENGYGVEVLFAGFERVTFHRDNMPAIERSMEQGRERDRINLLSEGRERSTEITRTARLEANRIQANALSEAEEIRGDGEAEAYRIEQEARRANPELYDLLGRLEVLEPLLGGQVLVLPTDHWLLEVLHVPSGPGAEPAAPADLDGASEGGTSEGADR